MVRDARERTVVSGVEPGREQPCGGAGEEGALEFFGGVAASFRGCVVGGLGAGFGAARGKERDHAGEDEPLPAARPLEKTAAIAKRGRGRRLDFRGHELAPDFLEARSERRLHLPNGVGAPRKNRGARGPCCTLAI